MTGHETPRRGGRRYAFFLIALALPLLVLTAVEGALRVADVAPQQPLFIQNPQHPEFSLANPRVIERFFSRADAAPNVSAASVIPAKAP